MCNLFYNIAAKRVEKRILRVLPLSFKLINNLICCLTGLNVVVKRVILLFHSFCSNVTKQVAWFCYPFYRRFAAPWVNKLQFTKNLQYLLLLTPYREQNKLHIFVERQKSNWFRQKLIRTRWNVSVRSRSNWKLKVLAFKERGKPEKPEKNLSEQGREPTTNSTHIWRRRQDLNPGHILRWEASAFTTTPSLLPNIDSKQLHNTYNTHFSYMYTHLPSI